MHRILVTAIACASTLLGTYPSGFSEALVATGLSSPTAMAFAPDGRLFVCEQAGALRVIKAGALLVTPFLSVSVNSTGERGLLGIAFDPNFAINSFLYVYYTTASSPIHNRVSRFTANGDVVVPASELVILDLDNLSSATNHNGGAIHFGPDGRLFVAVGENANGANSQSFGNRLGKILRINPDGTIPGDNPLLAQTTGANQAIWALGLRNPFTFAFHPINGRLHINDVGQSAWEEVNEGVAGSNYGWPIHEGFDGGDPNFRDPLIAYGHATGPGTGCAITGGAFYTGDNYPGAYLDSYFYADFCGQWIYRLPAPSYSVPTAFATSLGKSVVDLHVFNAELYYLTRDAGGSVYRIVFSTSDRPLAVSVTPSSGTGSTQTFSFVYSDPNGFTDISFVQQLIPSPTLSGASACFTHYDRASRGVLLLNDTATAWLGPVTLGTATNVQNSQCIVNAQSSSASGAGNNLTVNLNLTFKAAFAGTKNVYLQVWDNGGLASGFQQRGTWTVPGSPPTAVSVTPSSGSGSTQTFSFLYSDPNGFTDISFVQQLIPSPTLSGALACFTHYDRASNVVLLLNDAATAWLGPVTPGTANSVQNSQCTVNAQSSSASGAGNNLTVNLNLTFKAAFAGTKNVYLQAWDTGGLSTGFQQRGTWTVPNSPPTAVSVTPASGSGSTQTFSFVYSDPNGFPDIPFVQQLIPSPTLSGASACFTHYDRASNVVLLLNDGATAWLGPVTLGTANTVQNSQCTVNAQSSSASGVGNNLTVNLNLTFKPAFAGTKNVYLQAWDTGGLSTGFQQRGTWTVP